MFASPTSKESPIAPNTPSSAIEPGQLKETSRDKSQNAASRSDKSFDKEKREYDDRRPNDRRVVEHRRSPERPSIEEKSQSRSDDRGPRGETHNERWGTSKDWVRDDKRRDERKDYVWSFNL